MSDCPPSTADFVQPLLTWALVVLGWLVVHHTSVLRERRKEDLALIERLEKEVEALRDAAETYYATDPTQNSAERAAAQIKLKLRSLGNRLAILRERNAHAYDMQSELIALRQAISGGDFEAKSRPTRGGTDAGVRRIWSASDNLVTAMYAALHRAHPTSPFRLR